jgi:hypothetical protein
VVDQAAPDPFVGQRSFGVLRLDYGAAREGGDTHADDREVLQDGFSMALRRKARASGIRVATADGAGDAPFVIRARVVTFDPGAEGSGSHVKLDVSIVDGSDHVLDELVLTHGTDGRSGRVRADGIALGEVLGAYLKERVGKVTGPAPDDEDGEEPPAPTRPVAPRPPRAASPPPPPEPSGQVVEGPQVPVPIAAPPQAGRPQPRSPAQRPVSRPARPARGPLRPPPKGTPIASFPGFSRLADGRSRVWVEVDRKVDVTASRSPLQIVYRLRGAAIVGVTNELPLVTGFYTTPVDRAQLLPAGADLDLVIDLREVVTPTSAVVETPRGIVLWVDFPKSTRPPPDMQAPPAPPAPPARSP